MYSGKNLLLCSLKTLLATLTLLLSTFISAIACERMQYAGPPNFPPWSWQETNGAYHGVGVYMLEEVAARIGVETIAADTISWKRAYNLAQMGDIDALVAMTWNDADSYHFTYPTDMFYAFEDTVILAHKNAKNTNFTVKNLKKLTGVTTEDARFGNTFDRIAREQLTLHRVATVDKALELLLVHGRFEYMLYSHQTALMHAARLNLDTDLHVAPTALASEAIYIALSQKSQCWTKINAMTQAAHDIQKAGLVEKFQARAMIDWRDGPSRF